MDIDVAGDGRMMVGGVKPLVMPTLVRGRSRNREVLLRDFLLELDFSSAHDFGLLVVGEDLEMEEIVEKIEMGLDAHICLIEVNKDADLEDGIGIEVAKLNPVEVEKAMEKRMREEDESPLEERLEYHGLIGFGGREFLTCRQPPSDHCLIQQHTIPEEALKFLLRGA